MELDSVRGLKAEISEQIVAKMEIGTVESHAAASISKKPQNRSGTISLGVARDMNGRADDFHLAVRVTNGTPRLMRRVEDIETLANGEADIRVIGRVIKQQIPLAPETQPPIDDGWFHRSSRDHGGDARLLRQGSRA